MLGETGGRMALCNLSPVVAKTFQVTRMVSTSRSSTPPFEMESDVPRQACWLAPADEESLGEDPAGR